jgi:hypothetical protein
MNQMSAPPPTRGLAVIVVAVVVGGLILLLGFDDFGSGGPSVDTSSSEEEATTDTTAPPVTASTVPAGGEAPASVPVFVANGSGVQGKAAEITEQLRAAGYTAALEPGNAPATEISQVFFVPDWEEEAAAVAAALSLPADRAVPWPNPVPFEAPAEATVIVQVGTDLG